MSEQRLIEVYKADISMLDGETVQLFLEKLRGSIQEKFGKPRTNEKPGVYAWMRAVFPDRVVFEKDEEGPTRAQKYWSASYTRKDNGDFNLGAPTEVMQQVNFVPVSKAQETEQPERVEIGNIWDGIPR